MMPTMLQTLTSMILLAAMRTLSALKQCNRSSSKHPKYDKEIKREWGNVEDESLSISSPFLLLSISSSFPPSLSISSFSLHFLFISSFFLHFLAARLQRDAQPCLHLIAQCLCQSQSRPYFQHYTVKCFCQVWGSFLLLWPEKKIATEICSCRQPAKKYSILIGQDFTHPQFWLVSQNVL